MDAIADLPMHNDIDADYSPQYVKLARILRAKIQSGAYQHGHALPSTVLAREYEVSRPVAQHALAVLAASRYIARRGRSGPYKVTWQAIA